MLLAFLSFACGLILDSVAAGRWETKRRAYLAEPRLASLTAAAAATANRIGNP
jgi:hypothetical protein